MFTFNINTIRNSISRNTICWLVFIVENIERIEYMIITIIRPPISYSAKTITSKLNAFPRSFMLFAYFNALLYSAYHTARRRVGSCHRPNEAQHYYNNKPLHSKQFLWLVYTTITRFSSFCCRKYIKNTSKNASRSFRLRLELRPCFYRK